MAPIAYSGALQPKKKDELKAIAHALKLSEEGTKDDLQARIKQHLDSNASLEDDPRFAGLYGRRKRSVQPQLAPPSAPSEKPRSSNRVAGLAPIREGTPVKDQRDVSSFLKTVPASPEQEEETATPEQSPRQAPLDFPTPSSLPPLPLSVGPPSPLKSVIQSLPKPAEVRAAVERFHQQEVLPHGSELLEATRTFLSNSRNIWTVSALFELLYIFSNVIPWKYAQVPLSAKGDSAIPIPYPPLSTFQTSAFWLVLFHWALPTLFAPAVVGNLISFNPRLQSASASPSAPSASAPSTPQEGTSKSSPPPAVAFDPLTAAIVRLAASIAYPYASLSAEEHIYGLDVLGYNLRVFNASLGLAFAFAEAIQGAPRVALSALESRKSQLTIEPRAVTPLGRRLTAGGDDGETSEVD